MKKHFLKRKFPQMKKGVAGKERSEKMNYDVTGVQHAPAEGKMRKEEADLKDGRCPENRHKYLAA
jgi:hypothetical protein